MDSKTGAKTKRAIAAKKRRRRHRRNAITHAKSPKSNIVPKVSSFVQLNDKSNASINAKSTVAAKTETAQPTQPDSTSATSLNANSTAAAKTETAQSSQPDDKLDPVIKKAMPTIAAKMENSVSVELVEMKRAEKKCVWQVYRHSDTGERPFLYLVQENEAYLGGYNMATSPYHNLCRQ
jgi:hypothetical protein